MKLVLILLVATVSVKRVYSTMKHVKSGQSNNIDDEWLYDRFITFIKRDVGTINNVILSYFLQIDVRLFFL
jgi:hypothetical protein